jgi:hypothetical protein
MTGGVGGASMTGGSGEFRVEGGRKSAGGGFSFSVPPAFGGATRTSGSFMPAPEGALAGVSSLPVAAGRGAESFETEGGAVMMGA